MGLMCCENVHRDLTATVLMTGESAMFNRYNTVDFGDAQEAYRKLQEFLGQEEQLGNSGKSRAGTK